MKKYVLLLLFIFIAGCNNPAVRYVRQINSPLGHYPERNKKEVIDNSYVAGRGIGLTQSLNDRRELLNDPAYFDYQFRWLKLSFDY